MFGSWLLTFVYLRFSRRILVTSITILVTAVDTIDEYRDVWHPNAWFDLLVLWRMLLLLLDLICFRSIL